MELGDSQPPHAYLLEAPSALAASDSRSRGVSKIRLPPASYRDFSDAGELASSNRSRTVTGQEREATPYQIEEPQFNRALTFSARRESLSWPCSPLRSL